MKSTRPDRLLPLLALLAPALFACAAAEAPPSTAACAAARAQALAALDSEAISIANALDADAALADAATYELEKTAAALQERLEAERQAVEERYRRCLDQTSIR